jgi:hypothetical protein
VRARAREELGSRLPLGQLPDDGPACWKPFEGEGDPVADFRHATSEIARKGIESPTPQTYPF